VNTIFDFKQERSFKAFIIGLFSTITLLAVSTATLLVVTLSGNATADAGVSYTAVAPTYAQAVASNQKVDTAKLMLFNESNLKGALK